MVNLNDYSYIIKLHTKRNMHIGSSINYFNTSGSRHRDLLFDFISSKEKIKKCIDGFTADNKLGMASNYKIIVKTEKWDKASYQRSLDLLDRLGLPKKNFSFVVGTMFITRAELMRPLLALNFKQEDFAISERDKVSLAHVIERFFGHIVVAQGYKIKDCITPKHVQIAKTIFAKTFGPLLNFIYSKKHTKKGKLLIKICKIPVYSKPMFKS